MSLAVKSVSTADDEAQSLTAISPVISRSAESGAVWKTRISFRAEIGMGSRAFQKLVPPRWSQAPCCMMPLPDEMLPPSVGTGLRGSKVRLVEDRSESGLEG